MSAFRARGGIKDGDMSADPIQPVALFQSLAPALVLYARQWTPSHAEDVVHDVFVRLIEITHSGKRLPDDPRAWLFRSVRNGAISALRSGARRKRREEAISDASPRWFEPRVDDLIDAAEAQRAMESLPDEQREVVVLRVWANLGFQEIADIVGVAVSTAFERYSKALAAMKSKLEAGHVRRPA
jgi:RNA polymerase sigma factor (sigma-70 family)